MSTPVWDYNETTGAVQVGPDLECLPSGPGHPSGIEIRGTTHSTSDTSSCMQDWFLLRV